MKILLQRVKEANVTIDGAIYSSIGPGLLLLLGIDAQDNEDDIDWCVRKVINMRIFSDFEGKMNFSIQDNAGSILLISQFTLMASIKKGNRPSFIQAAKPNIAIPLYEKTIEAFKETGISTYTGSFGADMKVKLINDGPVTIIIDSKNKE